MIQLVDQFCHIDQNNHSERPSLTRKMTEIFTEEDLCSDYIKLSGFITSNASEFQKSSNTSSNTNNNNNNSTTPLISSDSEQQGNNNNDQSNQVGLVKLIESSMSLYAVSNSLH
jgi:hypothetical protein